MVKVVNILYGYEISENVKFLFPDDEESKWYSSLKYITPKENRYALYFIFENNTCKHVRNGEPHGWFKFNDDYIVYGQDSITIFNSYGVLLKNQYIR